MKVYNGGSFGVRLRLGSENGVRKEFRKGVRKVRRKGGGCYHQYTARLSILH